MTKETFIRNNKEEVSEKNVSLMQGRPATFEGKISSEIQIDRKPEERTELKASIKADNDMTPLMLIEEKGLKEATRLLKKAAKEESRAKKREGKNNREM